LNGRGGGAEKAVALAEQVNSLDQLTSRDSLVQALAEGGRCAPELGRCAPELESFSKLSKEKAKGKEKAKECKKDRHYCCAVFGQAVKKAKGQALLLRCFWAGCWSWN
jgi:hypothetical protein